jgi:hypothetical protein
MGISSRLLDVVRKDILMERQKALHGEFEIGTYVRPSHQIIGKLTESFDDRVFSNIFGKINADSVSARKEERT